MDGEGRRGREGEGEMEVGWRWGEATGGEEGGQTLVGMENKF